jgi:hypothetical protein
MSVGSNSNIPLISKTVRQPKMPNKLVSPNFSEKLSEIIQKVQAWAGVVFTPNNTGLLSLESSAPAVLPTKPSK